MMCKFCGRDAEMADVGGMGVDGDITITISYKSVCTDCAELLERSIVHNLLLMVKIVGNSSSKDRS